VGEEDGHDTSSEKALNSKRYAYNNNYKGKHPMTKTQWCRYQRQKKANTLKEITNVNKGEGK